MSKIGNIFFGYHSNPFGKNKPNIGSFYICILIQGYKWSMHYGKNSISSHNSKVRQQSKTSKQSRTKSQINKTKTKQKASKQIHQTATKRITCKTCRIAAKRSKKCELHSFRLSTRGFSVGSTLMPPARVPRFVVNLLRLASGAAASFRLASTFECDENSPPAPLVCVLNTLEYKLLLLLLL